MLLSPDVDAKLTQEFIDTVQQIQMSKAMAWVVAAIALVIGSVGMLNTMVMSVYERTKEIGVLRAIGWRKWRIVWMVMCESLLLSLGGAVVGVLCAVLLIRYLSTFPMTANVCKGKYLGGAGASSPSLLAVGGAIRAYPAGGGTAVWSPWSIPKDALNKNDPPTFVPLVGCGAESSIRFAHQSCCRWVAVESATRGPPACTSADRETAVGLLLT